MENTPADSALPPLLQQETRLLEAAWNRHDAAFLDTYLVQDVEDPRINIQSILTRHFLIAELFADRYRLIMEHELYFAMTANWLLKLLKSQQPRYQIGILMQGVFDNLLIDAQNAEPPVPLFIAAPFKRLAFPNYISSLLSHVPREHDPQPIPNCLLNTFQNIWAETLATEQAPPLCVLEPACGSANDYRFFERYGLARFLHYTGFDLAAKNIANAKRHFPAGDFRVASVFEIPAQNGAFDVCFVHDLFEHLSAEGIDRAVSEICRVAGKKVCLHFFNMSDADHDHIQQQGDYHWNKLSRQCMKMRLPAACRMQARRLGQWLNDSFGFAEHHNQSAWTWYMDLA